MFPLRISHSSLMRFILLPQHFSEEDTEAQRGAMTLPKHTGSRGEPPAPVLCMGWSLTQRIAGPGLVGLR